jgi:hypothetical protein
MQAANALIETFEDASEAMDAYVGQPEPEIPPNEFKPDGS